MKIPLSIVCVLLVAMIAGEGWTIKSIMELQVSQARLEARFDARLASAVPTKP